MDEVFGVSGEEREGVLDVSSFWEGVKGVTGDAETNVRVREERRRRVGIGEVNILS